MESEFSSLSNELDNIFLECPTDRSGYAEVQCLIDAFVVKYGNDQPELRTILTDKLDPQGINSCISRSYFKHVIMEWFISNNPGDHRESAADRLGEVYEYGSGSYAHSTPLGRYNKRLRKIPQQKLFYSPSIGVAADSFEHPLSGASHNDDLNSFKAASKTHNSSLENSLVKAEVKISSLETELKELKLHSKKEIERHKDEIDRLKTYEKLHAESINKNEKYEETLNNLYKEHTLLRKSKDILDKDYSHLENEFDRVKNELDAKIISIKTLENFNRAQTEELIVLQESRNALEIEVQKLKNDVSSRTENEGSLLNRIGELQCERQNLQSELNELMHFEKLKLISSSPFAKSALYDVDLIEKEEENRESGISMRSELMDSLGFVSCIQDSLHRTYLSIVDPNEVSSDNEYNPGQYELITDRTETIEIGTQTEGMIETRLENKDIGMQTERIEEIENEDIGIQTESIEESRSKLVESKMQSESEMSLDIDDGALTEVISRTCGYINLYGQEKETRTEELPKKSVSEHGSQTCLPDVNNWEIDSHNAPCSSAMLTDRQFDSSCFDSRMEIDSSLEDLHQTDSFPPHGNIYDGGGEPAPENFESTRTMDLVPLLRKPNMSTPQMRVRRVEPRRLSCIDVNSIPLICSRTNTYQKLTFAQKLSTILASIISIISPGLRVCLKTVKWVLCAALLFIMMTAVFFSTNKSELVRRQIFRPFLQLKYPSGPPPT